MKCLRCQQENPEGQKFCGDCGTPLQPVGGSARPAPSYAALQRSLTEALDQQTATSEILRVISSSPTDVQPIFEAIAESAARLCEAFDVSIFRGDGDRLAFVAHQGPIAQRHGDFSLPLVRGTVGGRSMLESRTVQVADLQNEDREFPDAVENARRFGFRTILSVPLLREGIAIGGIQLRRTEIQLFTDQKIALLQTFADQAVIAIENVRLFKELEARNRDLTVSLDRQTATADVLRIIAQSPSQLQPVLDAIAASAVRLCAASDAVIERLEGDRFYNAAHAGAQMKGLVGLPLPLTRGFPGGRAVLDRKPVIIDDIHLVAENEYPDALELLRLNTIRSVAEIPLLSEGKPLGSLAVLRAEVRPFTDAEVALLETFASQAVIAIENVRLFRELEARNRDLTEALDQQTATSEILRVISSSPTDLQPVMEALVASAAELCQAQNAQIFRAEDRTMRLVARHGPVRSTLDAGQARLITRGSVSGRTIVDRTMLHIPDLLAEVEGEYPDIAPAIRREGIRTTVGVPLLREGVPIGSITAFRTEVRPFTDKQITLLQTFADQAVIAIENVRLFTELETRNREIEDKSRQLEVASQHKSEFLANMSHELRTPLNAVIGFSEVLTDRMFGELNEKQDEYLKDIHASGQHLLSLINDILDLSKIEAGRMELEWADFHLPQAIDNALVLVRERALRRSITLEQSIDPRLGEIRGDERKVKQVLLNLLSNAIKFTPEGGRIGVRARPADGIVEVTVADTGVGIAPEDQEAIFEEFRQVGAAEKKAEGTGLGLALARKFIELHGGRIGVVSQVGVGSTFTFTLPVRLGE
jgi:two-component system, NtrC family, sensor kinase